MVFYDQNDQPIAPTATAVQRLAQNVVITSDYPFGRVTSIVRTVGDSLEFYWKAENITDTAQLLRVSFEIDVPAGGRLEALQRFGHAGPVFGPRGQTLGRFA